MVDPQTTSLCEYLPKTSDIFFLAFYFSRFPFRPTFVYHNIFPNFASIWRRRQVVDRWLSVRLELLGNVVVLSATLLSIFAATKGKLIAGLAGLSITNALRSVPIE